MEHAPTPWEIHGDAPEKPPMIWDASGDAIISQMPDGRPYFEPDDAAFIAAACNAHEALIEALKLMAGEFEWLVKTGKVLGYDMTRKKARDVLRSLER